MYMHAHTHTHTTSSLYYYAADNNIQQIIYILSLSKLQSACKQVAHAYDKCRMTYAALSRSVHTAPLAKPKAWDINNAFVCFQTDLLRLISLQY